MQHYTPSSDFVPSRQNAIAIAFCGIDRRGVCFETAYHPDRLNGMVVAWEGVDSLDRNWDRVSDIIQHFSDEDGKPNGEKLMIPRPLMERMLSEARAYTGSRDYS